MIHKYKCDVCRQRKIKCDEVKPTCTPCQKKSRPCSYDDEQLIEPGTSVIRIRRARTSHNGLALIGCHDTEDGALFQTWTFKTKADESPDLSRALTGPSTRLGSQWVEMLATISRKFAPTGLYDHFLSSIPMRIGTHAAVDTAAAYNLECFRSFTLDNTSESSVESLGLKALTVLRKTVSSSSERDEDTIMLSIGLLVMAEYLKGGQGALYMHTKAVCDIIKRRSAYGRWNDIDDALLKAIFQEDVARAVLLGQSALLDDPYILQRLQPEGERYESLADSNLRLLMIHMIRIPRLVALVRCCVHQAPDELRLQEILSLAMSLYDFQITTTSTEEDKSMPPRYYTFRLTICGIVQRMRDLSVASEADFEFGMIETEEEAIATLFANDLQTYFDPYQSAPWKAMRLTALVLATYGAWNRVEQRRRTSLDSGQSSAEAMQVIQRCLQLHAQVLDSIPGWDAEALLKQISEMVIGGPLLPADLLLKLPISSTDSHR